MISPAAKRIMVLIITLTQGEECGINLLNTETSKKPITKLTNRTFTSRSKMALNEKDSELNCIRKRKKSAIVQLSAIIKMIGSFRLFTADPLGTISLETLMSII